MKKSLQTILKIVFNKYLIVLVLFAVIMVTSEDHNLLHRYKNKKTIESLEKQISYYKNETAENKEKLDELRSDSSNLEKYARERYQMKKVDEDVYVIIQENEK